MKSLIPFIACSLLSFSVSSQMHANLPVAKDEIGCIRHPDTSINGVIFSDSKSFIKKFGDKYPLLDSITDCLYFANSNRTEFMTLHIDNGGARNSYDVFEVSRSIDLRKHIIKTKEKRFISSNGVYVGMPLVEFLKKYPMSCFSVSSSGKNLTYKYYDPYLTYLSVYVFSNNLLVSYTFGYDNS